MPLPIELGDAIRSWCNPAGEDATQVRFDASLFEGALTGYRSALGIALSEAEVQSIVPAAETIMLELAARFLADALDEKYFGWDVARFATRGDHNLLRATGQLNLAIDFAQQRSQAIAAVERLWRPTDDRGMRSG
jgi:hypothetical protein